MSSLQEILVQINIILTRLAEEYRKLNTDTGEGKVKPGDTQQYSSQREGPPGNLLLHGATGTRDLLSLRLLEHQLCWEKLGALNFPEAPHLCWETPVGGRSRKLLMCQHVLLELDLTGTWMRKALYCEGDVKVLLQGNGKGIKSTQNYLQQSWTVLLELTVFY